MNTVRTFSLAPSSLGALSRLFLWGPLFTLLLSCLPMAQGVPALLLSAWLMSSLSFTSGVCGYGGANQFPLYQQKPKLFDKCFV